jgi:O-antigen/teichoic acid export membrane protein
LDVRLGSVNLVSYLLQNAKKYASIGLLASGSSAALLMSFVRNLAIAGMMSLENYGAAATILICVSFAEMFSSLGWHQLIVQNRDGDQTRFQSCLHGPTILRGFLTALFLLVFGTQIAVILGVPDLVGAFQLLARLCSAST